jgi:hypothetical protein
MFLQLLTHKNYIAKLTCFFWLIAKIVSYKLWIANRFFPIIPPFDFLLQIPHFIHTFLFIASLVMLFIITFQSFNKKILIALFTIEILSCLLDQNRWQPWQYQYIITILVLYFNYNQPQKNTTWLSIILAATYFYSGLQKFNQGFILIVWQKAFLHDFFHVPTHIGHHKLITNAGFILPILEMFFAVGIIIKKTRKTTLYLLLIMHFFLLIVIGPLGLKVNIIVWPWNAVMIFYILYLLFNKNYQTIQYKQLNTKYDVSVLTVWCLFPVLNFVGYWDNFLSFSLYSGKIPNMEICVQQNLPKEIEPYFKLQPNPTICNGATGVNIQVWGMEEILVPPYPEVRAYKKIKEALEIKYPDLKAAYYVYWLPKSPKNYIQLR